ncbi:MAG: hypothetical protein ACREIC_13275 [Limisphaerales bacterium]
MLRAEVIGFVSRWPDTSVEISEQVLSSLCYMAVATEHWRKLNMLCEACLDLLARKPDFTFAFLNFVRDNWSGRASKSRRIQNFLALEYSFSPLPGHSEKGQREMTDGETATGFETSTKEAVSVNDVTKARKGLIRRIRKGQRFGDSMGLIQGGKKMRKPSFSTTRT